MPEVLTFTGIIDVVFMWMIAGWIVYVPVYIIAMVTSP
jgi:hypothetical protein